MDQLRAGWGRIAVGVLLCAGLLGGAAPAAAAPDSQYFPETQHTVSGAFWAYWQSHGGLLQQGYPITEEFQETSLTDGKVYTVQYFERALFELHPENAPPYTVLLASLGKAALAQRYPDGPPPTQVPNTDSPRYFPESGHSLGGGFRTYWEQHGGLAQYGFPLTDEFREKSTVDGKTYTVQYFERAVFEYHPEAPPGFRIQLSLLGRMAYHQRYETVAHPRVAQWPPAPGLPPPTHTVALNATFATPDLSAWQTLGNPDSPPSWDTVNAHLQQEGDAVGESSPDETVYAAGDTGWTNYILEAQFYVTSGDPVGVVWRAQDNSYYQLTLQPDLPNNAAKAQLSLVQNGHPQVLASTPANRWPGYQYEQWQTIRVVTQGAHQQVFVDGVPLLDVQNSALTHGQIGLYAVEDQVTGFDNVRVQLLTH